MQIGDQVEITFGKRRGERGRVWVEKMSSKERRVGMASVEYPEVKLRKVSKSVASTTKKKKKSVKRPCQVCGKAVYKNEEVFVMEKYWHVNCFKCTSCKKRLTLITYKEYRNEPFCETCCRTDNAAVDTVLDESETEKHRTNDVSPLVFPRRNLSETNSTSSKTTQPPPRTKNVRAAARRCLTTQEENGNEASVMGDLETSHEKESH